MAVHNISGKVNLPAVPPLFSYQKGFFVVNNFYDLMIALSSTETIYKTIFAPTAIDMTDYNGISVDLRGINIFPVGLCLEFPEDCTLIFNQSNGGDAQIITYDGLGLTLVGIGGTRNVSLWSQTDTSMEVLAKDLVLDSVNLTLNAGVTYSFQAEKDTRYSSTVTGTIGYYSFTTTANATASNGGLMSAADKGKLNNVADNANTIRSTFTATLASATWAGSSAPFTYTLTLSGILVADKPHVSVDYSATLATALLEKAAYACIDEVEATANDTLVFRCFETKPTQGLNIIVEVLRNG